MAIDFTGVTNVFMGGSPNVYSADTSLQCVYQGETEQWTCTDQGYVWRMMGSTIDGYDRFTVGDVVCIGTGGSAWSGAKTTDSLRCDLADNFLASTSNRAIDIDAYYLFMTWSDAIGSDGVKIGWHFPDRNNKFETVSRSYVVKQTDNNGVYARFSQGYGTLGTDLSDSNRYCSFYPLQNVTNQWWFTYSKDSYGNNQAKWLYGRICNREGSQHYIYSHNGCLGLTTNGIDANSISWSVIYKRVRIAQ